MELNEIIQMVANNGFAIAVAIYCLVFFDKNQRAMNSTLQDLKNLIERLIHQINENEKDDRDECN